jgi:hypothetical protein
MTLSVPPSYLSTTRYKKSATNSPAIPNIGGIINIESITLLLLKKS